MRGKQVKRQTMTSLALMLARLVTIVLALGFAAAPAIAAKASGAEHDKKEHSESHNKHAKKHGKEKAHKKGKDQAKKAGPGKHFNDKDEDVVRHYYQHESRSGKACPPGLAKKNNGCMPPGQAKKQWATGEPLPHDVEHHDLPRDLLSRLPIPPKGKRYVRILTDVLLIDTNTDVVVDAIADIFIP